MEQDKQDELTDLEQTLGGQIESVHIIMNSDLDRVVAGAEPPYRRIVAMIPDALDRRLAIAVATARRTKVSVVIEALGYICDKLEQEKPA